MIFPIIQVIQLSRTTQFSVIARYIKSKYNLHVQIYYGKYIFCTGQVQHSTYALIVILKLSFMVNIPV